MLVFWKVLGLSIIPSVLFFSLYYLDIQQSLENDVFKYFVAT